MAATNKDKNKALAALTSAALALPGLNAQAAIPSSSVKTNVSYGHYEESDNRMRVDVYHADAVLPITDRFELFFSLDRDTYSGATPAYSLPESMTKLPKYDYENPEELSLVDITSAASSAVTTDLLTTFFLNQFKQYKDNAPYLHDSAFKALQDSALFQALLTDTSNTAPAAFMPLAAQFKLTDATDPTNVQTQTNPAEQRLAIANIKDKVYDYVETSGDFLSVMQTFSQGKSVSQLIDDYLQAVDKQMEAGGYGDGPQRQNLFNFIENAVRARESSTTLDPTQSLGNNSVVQTAFDNQRTEIEEEFNLKKQEANDNISDFNDLLQNQLTQISVEFAEKIKPITDQFNTEKNTQNQANAVEQGDTFGKLVQTQTGLASFEKLTGIKTQAIEQSIGLQKQQTEQEYEFLSRQIDILPELTSGSALQQAITEANASALGSNSPFAGVLDAKINTYLSERDALDQQLAALDANLLNQLDFIQTNFDGDTQAKAADLGALLNTDKSAWLAAKQAEALRYLQEDLLGQTSLYKTQFAELLNSAPQTAGLSSADLDTGIDGLTGTYSSQAGQLLKNLNQAQSDLEFEYSSSLNPEVAAKLAALKQTYQSDRNELFDQKSSDLEAYKKQNPPPASSINTIDSAVTIDFPGSTMTLASYAGFANNAFGASGDCAGSGTEGCYKEDGFVVGIVQDSSNKTAHVHRGSGENLQDRALQYHADSTGIYIRALKGQAFSLDSMNFSAPITGENPDNGPNDYWEILGFSQASNPGMDSGDGTNYATRIAYQTIANGFDGLLNLNSSFENVKAVWIHYRFNGAPAQTSNYGGKTFDVKLDNINLSPVLGNADQQAWNTAYTNYKNQLDGSYAQKLQALEEQYTKDKAAIAPDSGDDAAYQAKLDELQTNYDQAKANLTTQYQSDYQTLLAKFSAFYTQLTPAQQSIFDTYKTQLQSYVNNYVEAIAALTIKDSLTIDQFNQQRNDQIEALQAIFDADNPRPTNDPNLSVTINFPSDNMNSASYGYGTNLMPTDSGFCPDTGGSACYEENGFVIGSPFDGNGTNHIHRVASIVGGGTSDKSLAYHGDSSGIYIRALDQSAFDLTSMLFNSAIGEENYIYGAGGIAENPFGLSDNPNDIDQLGPQEKWEIFGFENAVNTDITANDGYSTAIAQASIANGFVGTVGTDQNSDFVLPETFKNIKALWIHYNGYPRTPDDGIVFDLKLDNINLTKLTQAQLDWYQAKADLENNSPYIGAINNYLTQLNTLEQQKSQLLTDLKADLSTIKNGELSNLTDTQDTQISSLSGLEQKLQDLQTEYESTLEGLIEANQTALTELQAKYEADIKPFTDQKNADQKNAYQDQIDQLQAKLQALSQASSSLLDANGKINLQLLAAAENADTVTADELEKLSSDYETLLTEYREQVAAKLAEEQAAEIAIVDATQKAQQDATAAAASAAQTLVGETLARENTIALYQDMLNKLVPDGDTPVQRFMLQPQETRSMPQFSARYYWDATTLSVNGGLSDEPDFLSNFGSFNLSHEFNDKLTTVSAGYGMTNNQITRGTGHTGAGHDHDEPPAYPALNEESTSHNFNASLSQVLDKNTVYQFSTSFTHQAGYLSNPYKSVYIRGEVTAEEYYQMNLTRADGQPFDWRNITNLEMVSTELFREVRPDQRNMWSFSNRINHHIPALDASVHFDYRFYTDDWNINSHTFELKWYQNLPGGWTITPGIRYYSQSQAEFFAPYFLAPRADGHYSSDFRLSAFGDLSGGVTVSKQFARGISLEAGIEYVTHSGDLKLGGGGVGDYADFDYYIAHANLNIDFGARAFTSGDDGGHHHHHHHHGAPVPAGVMFGHMMNQADEIMIGYRYQYNVQSGSMLHGSDPASDAYLVANACAGNANGCLYKPTKMHMQMHMLDLMYAPTDWLNLMLMPQLMSMDMDMSQALRDVAIGEEDHGGTQHTSNDLGDTVATALVKIHDDGTHHVHVGIGMSAPTGSIDAQISQGQLTNTSGTERKPGSAVLQDYGMQLGSGTWDFKPSLTYTGHADDWGWGMQFSGVKRLNKNKYGYAYGDLFQATGWSSYQIMDWLSATVRGVYTWQDKIHGESSVNHENTSPVDFTHNYGGRFVDVGLGLNVTIPDGKFAGNSISVEWLQPVATDFNGNQLDRDGALAVSWSFSF